jgi:hypothetical protein
MDTRIQAATGAFMAMKDIFFDKKISLRTRKQIVYYADSNDRCSSGIRFLGFERDSYRQAYNISAYTKSYWITGL